MPDELILSDAHRRLVRAIVDEVMPGAECRVFGSRATGRARPFSDLDLLIVQPQRLSWEQRTALRDAFEASALPCRVDVVEVGALSRAMVARVQQEMKPL